MKNPLTTAFYIMAIYVVVVLIAGAFLFSGCTYNRNAPLVSSEIQVNDSANNNEIPLIK